MRLIDADALLQALEIEIHKKYPFSLKDLITNAPTVETQRQWVSLSDDDFKNTSWFTDEFIEGANWAQNKLKELNT